MVVVKNDFPRIAANLHTRSKAVVDHSAERIVADAERRAPVRSGVLRGSGRARGAEITFSAPYAGYVEHGTRNMAAEPFLAPAVEAEKPRFEAEMAALLKGA